MRKHCLVTILELLGSRSAIQPKYRWPIRIEELYNHMNVLEVDEKADYLKSFYYKYSPRLLKRFVVKLCLPHLIKPKNGDSTFHW